MFAASTHNRIAAFYAGDRCVVDNFDVRTGVRKGGHLCRWSRCNKIYYTSNTLLTRFTVGGTHGVSSKSSPKPSSTTSPTVDVVDFKTANRTRGEASPIKHQSKVMVHRHTVARIGEDLL